MERSDIIYQIHTAKRAHISWLSHAQALVSGLPLEKESIPIFATDCQFGQWYYREGQMLSSIDEFKAIEQPHKDLHQVYMKIFKLLFTEHKISLLQKILGLASKAKQSDIAMANRLLSQLEHISENMLKHLEALETTINNMNENQWQQLAQKATS